MTGRAGGRSHPGYRALLHLLPGDFRRAFGRDMEQLFADRLRETGSAAEAVRLWSRAITDVVAQAAGERWLRARAATAEFLREGMRMDGWKQDVRFGLRSLRRRPGFTAAAIGTLALGIGATVSIFTVVNGVLLKPLAYPDADRLVTLWNVDTVTGSRSTGIDHPDVRAWQQGVSGLDVAGIQPMSPTITGDGAPEVVPGARVTDGLMTLFGYTPVLGRDLTAADDIPDGPQVIVVSHSFWVNRLGQDPDVLGRTVLLSGGSWEVVGVAPPDFEYPRGAQLWIPRRHEIDDCGHGCRIMRAVGRVHTDASFEEVQAQLDAVSASLAADFSDSHRDSGTEIEPLLDTEVADIRTGLWVLFGAVAMVLMIACANVANLMLIRAGQRREEVALRLSLGASRLRIVRQLLTESFLIAGIAGVVGLALSGWGTSMLVAIAPDDLPRLEEAALDPTVVGFAVLLVFLVTSLFGVGPALQLSGRALRDEFASRSGTRRETRFSRSVLIAGEVGLSLALLLGAGLLFRTLGEIQRVDYGFAAESSERFRISVPGTRYDSLAIAPFVSTLEDRIEALPGVAAVGSGFGVPLASGRITATMSLLDRPEVDPADKPDAAIRPSSPGLLAAAGTPLVAGRWFTDDDVYESERVAVVNQAMVRRHYPDVDPIGRRVDLDVSWSFGGSGPLTIVGVVGDVRGASATSDPEPAVYLPNTQFGANSLYVWMRLRPGTATVMPGVRAALLELDPEIAIRDVSRVEEVIAGEQLTPRFFLTLLALFSVLALTLAAIGMYGVVAYTVSRRTREIGIRMALGAEREQVVQMVADQGVRPVVAGIAIGLALFFAGGRVLESLLFGVQPHDPLTMVLVISLLISVSIAATLVPAWRAARIPAAEALRTE